MSEKRKRPKVRYVVDYLQHFPPRWIVCHADRGGSVSGYACECDSRGGAERIAAALNFHEAHKRGEL